MRKASYPRAGLVLLALLGAAALWPAPYDPDAIVDPAVASNRPPGTRLVELHLPEGRIRLADRVEVRGDEVHLEARGNREVLPAASVLNLEGDQVRDHRRFLLGSDRVGRDVWSRILAATRISLQISFLALAMALTLGVAVGAAAALGGPTVDAVLMRGVDACLAFPQLFLVIALAALLSPSTQLVILLLGLTSWMQISRLTRAQILSLVRQDYVLASRGIGQSPGRIFWRHLLPGTRGVLLVESSLLVGDLILAEAGLSYFGLGVQPPTPSWGSMVSDGSQMLGSAWWVAVFPGIAIAVTVVGFNLLGDALRDRFDPRRAEK